MHSVFKARLTEALARTAASDAQIAANAGISIQALNNYKESRLPKLEQAAALAQALNVSVGWLIGESQNGASSESTETINLRKVWMALGNPLPDTLASLIGVPIERAHALLDGSVQPTAQEVASLLNEVACVAVGLACHLPAHRPARKRQANE